LVTAGPLTGSCWGTAITAMTPSKNKGAPC
jgi:hypothetical protein